MPGARPVSRGERLPDIEEISSSLRSAGGRAGAPATDYALDPEEDTVRRGRRTGFVSVLILFAILTAIYIAAAPIGRAVPALTPVLDRYVALVDQGRLWLDAQIEGLVSGLEAEGTGDAAAPAPPTDPTTAPTTDSGTDPASAGNAPAPTGG